jgi:hypothetical protein
MRHLFSVPLAPHNRWASAKVLREKWLHHIENSLYRPVLLIDEAQQMSSAALTELRLLSSAELDSRSILTTVLAGDNRLASRLQEAELGGANRFVPAEDRATLSKRPERRLEPCERQVGRSSPQGRPASPCRCRNKSDKSICLLPHWIAPHNWHVRRQL